MTIEFDKLITPDNFSHKAGDGTVTRKHHTSTICPSLQANCGMTQATLALMKEDKSMTENYRIRKLTPREDLRLMGWLDEDIDKIENIGMSDNQMIKQAGNGIVVNCVSLLFEHLYKAQYDESYECSDEVFLQAQAAI